MIIEGLDAEESALDRLKQSWSRLSWGADYLQKKWEADYQQKGGRLLAKKWEADYQQFIFVLVFFFNSHTFYISRVLSWEEDYQQFIFYFHFFIFLSYILHG